MPDEIKISDIGHAIITLDLQMDALHLEQEQIELQLEQCKARQVIIAHAINRLLDTGRYMPGSC